MHTSREHRLDQDRQETVVANKAAVIRDFEASFPDVEAFHQLVESFFLHFPQDQASAKAFFQMLEKETVFKDKAYLDLLQALFQDVVAYGFPKIMGIFTIAHQDAVRRTTERSPLDPLNILAIRTYLADINLQTLALKQKYLDTYPQTLRVDWDRNPEDPTALHRRVAGTMLTAQDGKVVNNGQLELSILGVQQRAKFPSDVVWLPDREQASAMLALGKALGRKDRDSRDATYKVLGRLRKRSLTALFPNLQDESVPVSLEERSLIETAFRGSGPNPVILKYDQLRNLFARTD